VPLNKYFHGHGDEVMSQMQKQYGEKKGKSVFYATANKTHQTAKEDAGSKELARPRKKK